MTSQQLGREERKSHREKKYGVRDQDSGSSLNLGPLFYGPVYKDAVLSWGPEKGP